MSLDDSIVVTYGSCIDLEFGFSDEEGDPEDISMDEFSVLSSSAPSFNNIVFTKVEPLMGKLHLYLSAEDARKLNMGPGNWFRLRRVMPDGCEDNTPKIPVTVK